MSPVFHMITGAPDPVAPFSHAVEADGWVFVTGQMPFVGTSLDSPYPEGIEAQTRQVLKNLQTVLSGCGLGLEHALSVRVYLTHFDEDYAGMNAEYANHFEPGRRPARTCVGVAGLAKGARIEIDLVAWRGNTPAPTTFMRQRGVAQGRTPDTHALTEARQGKFHYTIGPYSDPVLKIRPGDRVVVETRDAFEGKVKTEQDLPSRVLSMPFVNPQNGPILVEGATKGDVDALRAQLDRIEALLGSAQ